MQKPNRTSLSLTIKILRILHIFEALVARTLFLAIFPLRVENQLKGAP